MTPSTMTDPPAAPVAAELPEPTRPYRWLPTVAALPGMTVARPVVGHAGPLQTMYLAVGATITASTITQMLVKGVECVAAFDPPDLPPADAAAARAHEARLREIFGTEPATECLALRDALLQQGPAR